MIKLNTQVKSLQAVLEKIERKIEELEETKYAIIEGAEDNGREPSKSECNKLDKLQEQIDQLQDEADEIESALDHLKYFAD
jgi:prefoldin subunit 5